MQDLLGMSGRSHSTAEPPRPPVEGGNARAHEMATMSGPDNSNSADKYRSPYDVRVSTIPGISLFGL